MNIIGIDSGSSAVKMVELNSDEKIINQLMISKIPVKQAIDTFVNSKNIDKRSIEKIVITGVGKDEINESIYGIPTIKVDEFTAIGEGGLSLANKEEALIVSIGTGTAFVRANKKGSKHIGGTGIGGGTLLNLCKKIGNVETFEEINEAISKGSLKNIDLTIQDVAIEEIKTLPKDTTSANFGKLSKNATNEDMILGIANMIFETIGMMAVFATQNIKKKNIIVIGSVATIPYINIVLGKIEKLHNVKFIIPEQAEYACILGAIKST